MSTVIDVQARSKEWPKTWVTIWSHDVRMWLCYPSWQGSTWKPLDW